MAMRFLPFLLLTLPFFVKAQTPAADVAPADAAFKDVYMHRSIPVVTGRLLHLTAAELAKTVISYVLVTPFDKMQVGKTTTPQPDGRFQLQLDYALPYQQIWFGVGDTFYAALYANKDLYVELDMKKIEDAKGVSFDGDGVRYGGTDGPLTTWLNDFILYRRPEQLHLSDSLNRLTFAGGPLTGDKRTRFDRYYDTLTMIDNDYIATHPSPYGWLLTNERWSDYYASLLNSHIGRVMDDTLFARVKQHKSYLISNSSAAYYRGMAMYLRDLPGRRPAVRMADTTDIQRQVRITELASALQRIDSLFPPSQADFLKLHLNSATDVVEQGLGWESIAATMHTGWCIAVAKSENDRTVAQVKAINATLAASATADQADSLGKPLLETPFGARMYAITGMHTSELLARLRLTFPGKALIIDRWATWCAPCVAEMPHSKKLAEASKDLPVVFVYLCTLNGSTAAQWKNKVMELAQPGIHILIDKTMDAEISKYFSFSGYPGYALIGKNGTYKPGAITWLSSIPDRAALADLINN
jgi:thiol-disulfide isomerase/thioredoxin